MPIALAVAVSFHNLVPRDGIIGMQWEYFTKLLGLFSNVFCMPGAFTCILKRVKFVFKNAVGFKLLENRSSNV